MAFFNPQRQTWWQKIFKPIPWYYHGILFILSLLVCLLFQQFGIKSWNLPLGFLPLVTIPIWYLFSFILISPLIKARWFLKKANAVTF